ncbi:hypothetical protein PITC_055340 [Penicillium italicum]|uniref:Uncharacterized protein n=1 Tax=Penicillium italicum TaxID=40296 RepID=A0A0A2LBN0_PENIT|nr:hypothetical protein PITC_055340 [Penicillium italicum]
MSTHLFCCTAIQPTKPPIPDHEKTFTEFTKWGFTTIGNLTGSTDPSEASVCIQLVRQVNSGPIESIRYFVASDNHGSFEEVSEDGIMDANFVKINDTTESLISTSTNQVQGAHVIGELVSRNHSSDSRMQSNTKHPDLDLDQGRSQGRFRDQDLRWHQRGLAWDVELARAMGTEPGWDTALRGGLVWDLVVDLTGELEDRRDIDGEDQDQNQDQDRDAGISQSDDGTQYTNQDNNEDQPVSSSPTLDTEVTQDNDAGSFSPPFGTQVTSYDEDDSSDDYGSYDCYGGDNGFSYDQDCGDCGGCDD